jgi:hypothetical protein
MSRYGTCALCGEEILEADLRDRYHQATGWHPDRRRKTGGHHSKGKFWHNTGALAHGKCVEDFNRKQKAGISPRQPGLF